MAIEYASHKSRANGRMDRGVPRAFEEHLRRTGQTLEAWEARQSPVDVEAEVLRLQARRLRMNQH